MTAKNNCELLNAPNRVTRILAITLGGLGDAILFSPVLKALRLRYPTTKIELLLASKFAESAYRNCREVDNIHVIMQNQKNNLNKAIDIINFALKTRLNGKFDIAVFAIGLNSIISKILKFFGDISVVYNASANNLNYTDLDCNLNLAKVFYYDISPEDVFIPITEESESEAEKALEKNSICLENDRLVAVYPSVSLWHRPRWELFKLLKVIYELKKYYSNIRFVTVGSAMEGAEWRKIDVDHLVDANLSGKLSILGTASLLKRCLLSICNDGGIMHVAGAVRCPVVAIMPNTPANYHPPGEKTKIIHPNISCAIRCYPNRPKNCKTANCIEDITVAEVFKACIEILDCNESIDKTNIKR
jgi:ADP-heptose:LPS heptosyltransferase